jgi:hypothetical protein
MIVGDAFHQRVIPTNRATTYRSTWPRLIPIANTTGKKAPSRMSCRPISETRLGANWTPTATVSKPIMRKSMSGSGIATWYRYHSSSLSIHPLQWAITNASQRGHRSEMHSKFTRIAFCSAWLTGSFVTPTKEVTRERDVDVVLAFETDETIDEFKYAYRRE